MQLYGLRLESLKIDERSRVTEGAFKNLRCVVVWAKV